MLGRLGRRRFDASGEWGAVDRGADYLSSSVQAMLSIGHAFTVCTRTESVACYGTCPCASTCLSTKLAEN